MTEYSSRRFISTLDQGAHCAGYGNGNSSDVYLYIQTAVHVCADKVCAQVYLYTYKYIDSYTYNRVLEFIYADEKTAPVEKVKCALCRNGTPGSLSAVSSFAERFINFQFRRVIFFFFSHTSLRFFPVFYFLLSSPPAARVHIFYHRPRRRHPRRNASPRRGGDQGMENAKRHRGKTRRTHA